MQIAATFEYQPGQLIDFGNRYYYGDLANIKAENPRLDEWFNTTGTPCSATPGPNTGWELCPQRQPAGFQARIFPTRLEGVRRDHTLQTNANVQKEIPLRRERVRFYLRFDMLNVFNRYQFDSPNADPTNTNFGAVTQQTAAVNRFLEFRMKGSFSEAPRFVSLRLRPDQTGAATDSHLVCACLISGWDTIKCQTTA